MSLSPPQGFVILAAVFAVNGVTPYDIARIVREGCGAWTVDLTEYGLASDERAGRVRDVQQLAASAGLRVTVWPTDDGRPNGIVTVFCA